MKKTEKIEIRLSHEEKVSLSKLAEDEGRSVSDLVRGLIDRYMSLHRDRLPQKPRWGRMALIGISGLLIGHLGTYFMVQAHSHNHFEIYQLGARIQSSFIEVPITRTEGEVTKFVLPNPNGDINLTAEVKKGSGILSEVEVTLCQMLDARCKEIASPKLTFNSQRHSIIQFVEGDNEISLTLAPPPPKTKK
jgi:hypothetical protein